VLRVWHERVTRSSLGTRLTVVALLALLPAFLMALAWANEERREALVEVETNLQRSLTQIATINGAIVEQVAPVLKTLSELPEIRALDAARCGDSLRAVRDGSGFAGLVLANPAGDVVCNGRQSWTTNYRGDRLDFRRVIETQQFAVGAYTVGRESHQVGIHFGQPVFGQDAKLVGVLTASLSVQRLNDYLARIPLPPKHALILTDAGGTVLARQPEAMQLVGLRMPRGAGAVPQGHVFEAQGLDDNAMLFVTAHVGDSPATGLTLWLGVEKRAVTRSADAIFREYLRFGLALSASMALLIWLASYVLLRKPARRLADAARQIAIGDFTLDPVRAREAGELGELGAALDDMAAKLAARETALVESDLRFRSTFENAAVGISHLTREGRWLRVNDRQCQITGYSREELLTRRAQDITHPDDVAEGDNAAERLWAGEIAMYARRKRLIRKNGEIIWVAITVSLARKPDGSPDYTITIIEDITKAKEAEEELATANRLLDGVIENLPAVVFLKRASDLRYVRVNRAGEDLLGYPRDHFVGKSDYEIYPREQADFFTTVDREVLASGGVREISEAPVRTGDGTTRYFRSSKSALRDADGTPTHLLGVGLDITERKEAEEHVKLLMREIDHRAKNLLTVVQAVARQTAGEVTPKVFAEHFSQRLAGLAASHDLLARNRWKGVDAADLVRSQLAHFGALLGTRVRFEGPRLRLKASAAQALGMALHELATNTIKYGALSNPEGSVEIRWAMVANGAEPCFTMTWSEQGGPAPQPPEGRGFGHTVVVEMVEHALDASVHLAYPPSGFEWRFVAPTERVLEHDAILPERIDQEAYAP
jgi:PAS domain S-box-containing protein